jgi:seryl-tRNA synthetase
MIDIKAARANPDAFRIPLARKGADGLLDSLLAFDERWRALQVEVDELRSALKTKGKPDEEERAHLQEVSATLKRKEKELQTVKQEREYLLIKIPNPPHESAPDGETDEEAVVLRTSGTPEVQKNQREHTEIGRFEMERAARISGSGFGYMVGDTARVARALYAFALDHLARNAFTEIIPPVLVREEAMYGTGFFPTEKSNIYSLESDDLFLTGTSEVALGAFHMGEILDPADFPIRYAGFSTCFRREAGAAGRDTRGMFRVHQFQKVEMFVFTEPEKSWEAHERMVGLEEEFLQTLGLPYRVVNIPVGDLGAPAAKKIDIEGWFPAQGRYRELTSCSNTTDYQARRLGIRFKRDEVMVTPHTLNGTMVTDRCLLALLENFGGEVPEVLWNYGAPKTITR